MGEKLDTARPRPRRGRASQRLVDWLGVRIGFYSLLHLTAWGTALLVAHLLKPHAELAGSIGFAVLFLLVFGVPSLLIMLVMGMIAHTTTPWSFRLASASFLVFLVVPFYLLGLGVWPLQLPVQLMFALITPPPSSRSS